MIGTLLEELANGAAWFLAGVGVHVLWCKVRGDRLVVKRR